MIWEELTSLPILDDTRSNPERIDCGTDYDHADRFIVTIVIALVCSILALTALAAMREVRSALDAPWQETIRASVEVRS